MKQITEVQPSNSCVNCFWFEIEIVSVTGTYYENTLAVDCGRFDVGWCDDLTHDPDTLAIASPESMKCDEWEAVKPTKG